MNSQFWFDAKLSELEEKNARLEREAEATRPIQETPMDMRLRSAELWVKRLESNEVTTDEFREAMAAINRPVNLEVRDRTPNPEDNSVTTYTQEDLDAAVRTARESSKADKVRKASKRGRRASGLPEIEGRPNEPLKRGQSVKEWVRRASENGVQAVAHEGARPERITHRDNDYLNAYWGQVIGQQIGQNWVGRESRAILEDTAGSGLAITPQSWNASFVDYLYPLTVLGRAGVTQVPMATELVNVPVLTSPSQPAWLPEAASIGVDSSPAFSTVQLSATGGTKWTTLVSIEMAHDAYVSGSLPDVLAQSLARQVAVQVDTYGFFGTALTNTGLPGLINETGTPQNSLGSFNNRYYTGATSGSPIAPSDTTELSKIRELLANKNVDTSASDVCFISNPSVKGTILRTNASTYARFWDVPPDVARDGLDKRWFESANTIFPTTETAPATSGAAPAQTGSTASSLYAGPFSYVLLGSHVDLQTRVLTERYIDVGMIGLFAFARYSVRCPRPDLFYRTHSIATT